jgi:N-methylhydantoinase A
VHHPQAGGHGGYGSSQQIAGNRLSRIAIDIGGTFTDVVLEHAARQWPVKVLTTSGAPEKAVLEGVHAALQAAGLKASDPGVIIHGTTLATNALIERKGARTAMLTTEGFRDTVELGTESRFEQYDLNLQKPPPLVPRNWRFPVRERIAADGAVLRPLDEGSVAQAINFLKSQNIESVAVGFLHSYANPAHERRVRELIREQLPGIPISLSSEVSPEMREYERFTTTCANAYVQPAVAGYLARLERDLRAAGLDCPVYLMISSGGLTTLETGRAFPIRLVESGPAGGAIFARDIAARHGAKRVLSFDMGGTTAKVCLIDDLKPQTTRLFEVARSYRFRKGSGMPVRIPAIEMVEIGAGGGSIARVDRLSRIGVGPDSAGADPGPACYGRGTAATVTDADLMLGRLDPAHFAGGRLKLEPERARNALKACAADGGLKLSAEELAAAVAELVDEAMANAARVHAAESGKTLAERTLIAFGGAAPLHVARVAEKLGISRILVPVNAGVGSAVGFLRAPISYEVARSFYVRLRRFAAAPVNALFAAMADEARSIVSRGAQGQSLSERRTAFARYIGQGHEVPLDVAPRALRDSDGELLRGVFEAAYLERYGRLIEGVDVEVLGWTLSVSTPLQEPEAIAPARGQAPLQRAATYSRDSLSPGCEIAGPARIVEDSTTTVLAAGFDAVIAADRTIVMTRRPP